MGLDSNYVHNDPLVRDFCDPAMDINTSIRIPECSNCEGEGNQNGVQISRVSDGWTWWCYRCQLKGKFFDIGGSPSDTLARLKRVRKMISKKYQKSVQLPDDFVKEVPDKFLQWLWGYELDGNDVIDNNMGFSEMWNRLIIPVYISGIYGNTPDDGRMVAWTGRTLAKVTPENPKWHTVREYGVKYIYFSLLRPDTDIIVLVEDVISAIKIWKAGYNAIALLTTYVPNELYLGLKKYNIKVWLDPDAVGKSMGFVSKFSAMGHTAKHLAYFKDPKDCPIKEIPGIVE